MITSPVFSLIIPTYLPTQEKQDMLDRLVKSIPVRADLEILICNDKSPLQVETKHPNATVIEVPAPNGSAGHARNVGLQHAKGAWIFFADSDDYFKDTLTQQLDIVAEQVDTTDMVYFTMLGETQDRKQGTRHLYSDQKVREHIKNPQAGTLLNHFIPTSKFVRRAYLEKHKIHFGTTKVANDLLFSVKLIAFGGNTSAFDIPAYVLTQGHESLSTRKDTESLITRIRVKHEANTIIRQLATDKQQSKRIPLLGSLLEVIKTNPVKGLIFTLSLLPQNPYLGWKRAIRKAIKA